MAGQIKTVSPAPQRSSPDTYTQAGARILYNVFFTRANKIELLWPLIIIVIKEHDCFLSVSVYNTMWAFVS